MLAIFPGREAKTLLICPVFFVVWLSFRGCMVGVMLYWSWMHKSVIWIYCWASMRDRLISPRRSVQYFKRASISPKREGVSPKRDPAWFSWCPFEPSPRRRGLAWASTV